MTPEQRRAHLVLQGQTLLDEWLTRCAAIHEETEIIAGVLTIPEYSAAIHRRNEASRDWAVAVHAEFGMGCTMRWSKDSLQCDCTLSNGEVYTWHY